MHSVERFTLNNFLHFTVQTGILSLFLLIPFRDSTSSKLLILFSIIIVIICQDLILAFLSIIISMSLIALITEFEFLASFFLNKTMNYLIFIFLLMTLLSSLVLSKFKSSLTKEKYFLEYAIAIVILFVAKKIFDTISNQTVDQSLRYLVYTGEDNEAWLNGLASGFNLEGNYTFQLPLSSDVRSTTHTWLIVFRQIFISNEPNNLLTNNIVVLQNFYFFVIFLNLFLVTIGAARLLKNYGNSNLFTILISALAGISTYLSAASFGMFGHLTPILSLTYVYSALIFLLLYDANPQSNFVKITIALIFFILIFSSKNAWYPISPFIYLTALIFLFHFSHKNFNLIKVTLTKNKIIMLTAILFVIVTPILFVKLIGKNINVNELFLAFTELIHIPGGSLAPGTFHLLFFFGMLTFYFGKFSEGMSEGATTLFRITSLSITAYYLFVLVVSLITPPYSIEYAGNKLGLFVLAAMLPFNLIYASAFLMSKSKDFFRETAILLVGLSFIIFAGSPTISGNPTWPQNSFPMAVVNRINSEDTYFWEEVLISMLNDPNNSDKTILCFDKYVVSPDVTQSCSRFATALQGVAYTEFSQYWLNVNWNYASETNFRDNMPKDFYSEYDFVFFDELREPPVDATENYVSKLIPRKID